MPSRSAQFTFGRTLSNVMLAKHFKEKEDEKAAAQQFHDELEKSRQATEAEIQKFVELGQEAATAGADTTKIRDGMTKVAESYAVRLAQLQAQAVAVGADPSQLPSPQDFIARQQEFFDLTVGTSAATAASQEVQTLPPEQVEAAGFPEGAVVQKDPSGKLDMVFNPTEDADALQRRVDMLVSSGVDLRRAEGIAAGRYHVSLHPIDRTTIITDLAGNQVGDPVTEPADTTAVVPPGTETGQATGAEGVFKNALNALTDSVGGGLAFPEAQQATDALQFVQTTTKLALQVAIPGKPAKDIRDDLEKLTVTPNALFQGDERAKSKMEQMILFVQSGIEEREAALEGKLQPGERQLLEANIRELKVMEQSYQDLIAGFDTEGVELDPEIEALVKKYEDDGDTSGTD